MHLLNFIMLLFWCQESTSSGIWCLSRGESGASEVQSPFQTGRDLTRSRTAALCEGRNCVWKTGGVRGRGRGARRRRRRFLTQWDVTELHYTLDHSSIKRNTGLWAVGIMTSVRLRLCGRWVVVWCDYLGMEVTECLVAEARGRDCRA